MGVFGKKLYLTHMWTLFVACFACVCNFSALKVFCFINKILWNRQVKWVKLNFPFFYYFNIFMYVCVCVFYIMIFFSFMNKVIPILKTDSSSCPPRILLKSRQTLIKRYKGLTISRKKYCFQSQSVLNFI